MPELPLETPQPATAADPWLAVRDGLEYFRKPLSLAALAIAHANREQVTPHLVKVLETVARDPAPAIDPDYTLHSYAMLLLACWRDARAWPALLAWGRFDEPTLDGMLGDMLTQSYGRALASVCPGDTEPLRALIDDPQVLIWVRLGALDAWKLRVMKGDSPADPFEGYLLDLGERLAAQLRTAFDEDRMTLLADIASQVCDVSAPRLLEPVRRWFDDGLIDKMHIDRDFFEREFAQPLEARMRHVRGYIDDVAEEVAWWNGFADASEDEDQEWFDPPLMPIVRDGPKIGRNDPCPCGSGKKYKKCHGAS